MDLPTCLMGPYDPSLMGVYAPCLMGPYHPSLMGVYAPCLMGVYTPHLMGVYTPRLMGVYFTRKDYLENELCNGAIELIVTN